MTKRLSETTTQNLQKSKDEITKIELKLQKSYNHEKERSELDATLKINQTQNIFTLTVKVTVKSNPKLAP